MDSMVTGPITSFSKTCKPASTISKCVTPGIGKSEKKGNVLAINIQTAKVLRKMNKEKQKWWEYGFTHFNSQYTQYEL